MSAALILFVVATMTFAMWCALAIRMRGLLFEMDPSGKQFTFFAPFAIYRHIFGAIFVFSLILSARGDADDGALLLTLAAVDALLLILWLNFCYERYLHQRYSPASQNEYIYKPSPYTGRHYAFTMTLGIMSIFLFIAGLLRRFM